MPTSQPPFSLKAILLIDSATCLVMGVALIAAAGLISGLTAIPQTLLVYAGALLVPTGLFMASTGLWWRSSAFAVWLVIIGNVAWVSASLALLAGIISPNALGVTFILVQAIVVGVIAWLERRAQQSATFGGGVPG